jgi:hypothetical protein
MTLRTIKGKYNNIKNVEPSKTYFIVDYENTSIQGGGLDNTGWQELPDGIVKITYFLSTGVVIEIPPMFEAYLHLVEVSRAILDNSVVYHYVFIKGKLKDKIISYRISLKEDTLHKLKIGDIHITEDETPIKSNYWKKAEENYVRNIN